MDQASGGGRVLAGGAIAGDKIGMDGLQQGVDGAVPMVAGDVRVQVEPDALDPVLSGAVRRQKCSRMRSAQVARAARTALLVWMP